MKGGEDLGKELEVWAPAIKLGAWGWEERSGCGGS